MKNCSNCKHFIKKFWIFGKCNMNSGEYHTKNYTCVTWQDISYVPKKAIHIARSLFSSEEVRNKVIKYLGKKDD